MFKRGKDTEWDANCGMEEIREFCFKEFAVACLFWNFFVLYYSNNITYHPKEVYAYRGSPIKKLRQTLTNPPELLFFQILQFFLEECLHRCNSGILIRTVHVDSHRLALLYAKRHHCHHSGSVHFLLA